MILPKTLYFNKTAGLLAILQPGKSAWQGDQFPLVRYFFTSNVLALDNPALGAILDKI